MMRSAREIRQELRRYEKAYLNEEHWIARIAFAARICALQWVLFEPQPLEWLEDDIGPKRLAEYTRAEIASVIWPA